MKKQQFILFLMTLVMVLSLVGCTNDPEPASASEPRNTIAAGTDVGRNDVLGSDLNANTTIAKDPSKGTDVGPNDNPEPGPDTNGGKVTDPATAGMPAQPADPYEVLRVTEDFARAFGGVYLRRNGEFYTLTYATMEKYHDLYGVGRKFDVPLKDFKATQIADFYDSNSRLLISNEVPTFTLEDGDEILGFGDTETDFFKWTFYGYTCSFVRMGKANYYDFGVPTTKELFKVNGVDQVELRDADGNLVEDWNSLEKDAEYVASWFKGTDYFERPLTAKYSSYQLELLPQGRYSVTLKGTLDKGGFVVYTLPDNLSPAFYTFEVQGVPLWVE